MPSLVCQALCHFNRPLFKGFRKQVQKACKKLTSVLRKSKNRRINCKKQFTSVSVQTSFESLVQTLSHEGELDMSHHNSSGNNHRSIARPQAPRHKIVLPDKPCNPSSKKITSSTSTSRNYDTGSSSTNYVHYGNRRVAPTTKSVHTGTPTLPRVHQAHRTAQSPRPKRRSNSFNSSTDATSNTLSSPRVRRRESKQQQAVVAEDQLLKPHHRALSMSSVTSALLNATFTVDTDNRLHNENPSASNTGRLWMSTKAEESPPTNTRASSDRGNIRCPKDAANFTQISPSRTKDRSDSPSIIFAKLLRFLRTKSKATQATPVGVEGMLMTGGIVGLRNLGNTCFMNSALQCLSHTLELTQEYLCSDSPFERKALGTAYAKLMHDMWSKSASGFSQSISPYALKAALSKVHVMFAGYGQQDSQELLRLLLSELHEECKSQIKKKSSVLVPISGPSVDVGDERWHSYFQNEDTPVSRVFMGQLRSTLVCETCNEVSTTFDPFWDLPLPIPHRTRGYGSTYSINDLMTLDDCISHFTKEEILDGSNKAYCNNCRALRRTRKQLTINRFPPVLVVYLQRFSSQSYRNKLTTVVKIPTVLDLTSYASKASVKSKYGDKRLKYELYASSNHIGSVSFGHYTALAKHYATDQWWVFNDACVTRISNPDRLLNTSEPYMMLYRRTLSTE